MRKVMNERKMGFKNTILERLQDYEVVPGQTSPTQNSVMFQQPSNCSNITDFSINRILSSSNKEKSKILTSFATKDVPLKSSPLNPTKGSSNSSSMDILDLSKANSTSNYSCTESKLTSPLLNYNSLHVDFVAATKFYAQFFPHMFPAYNGGNLSMNLNSTSYLPNPAESFTKYFNSYHNLTSANPCIQVPIARVPGPQLTLPKSQCSEKGCLECLDYYNKAMPVKPKPVTPLAYQQYTKSVGSPLASTVTNSTNISLTCVNNINLTSTTRITKLPSAINSLTKSIVSNTEEISYKCRICDKVFGCLQTLQAHEKTHKSPRYECTDCGKGFSQLRNYKYHISVHRGTKEFAAECPECGKTFNDKGYLSSHMKIHRNKKEYECPYCPKSFNQRVAFNMHVRIHTGVKPHKCTECGKRFSRKMLLKQHMRTHSGEKPYQCSVCGKSFADRSNMTLHHRLHSGIKPFSCPICPKAFTKKHHLKTHLNYHTGCKPYVCPHPNCNQAFTQSSNMRTHAKKCQYRPLQYPGLPEKGQAATMPINNPKGSNSLASSITVARLSPTFKIVANSLHSNELNSLNSSTSSAAAAAACARPLPTLSLSPPSYLTNTSSVTATHASTTVATSRLLSTSSNAPASLLSSVAQLNGHSNINATSLAQAFPFAQQPLMPTLRQF